MISAKNGLVISETINGPACDGDFTREEANLKPDTYLAFLGRMSPEKRVDRAIKIAKAAGRRLKIAAKIDPNEQDYFDREIKHLQPATQAGAHSPQKERRSRRKIPQLSAQHGHGADDCESAVAVGLGVAPTM
jgi:glycosyltransferase involved in cell wall biosynthesis